VVRLKKGESNLSPIVLLHFCARAAKKFVLLIYGAIEYHGKFFALGAPEQNGNTMPFKPLGRNFIIRHSEMLVFGEVTFNRFHWASPLVLKYIDYCFDKESV
jgi:hypothetical protein